MGKSALEIVYNFTKQRVKELERENKALQELASILNCLLTEDPSYYGRDKWKEHRGDYLEKINAQEVIAYGCCLTNLNGIKKY